MKSNFALNFLNLRIFLVLFSFLALGTGCTPRDVDPLSKADKDFVTAQRNKGKTQTQGAKMKPGMPERVDLATGLLMIDREAEALQVFKMAQDLLKAESEKLQNGCVRTKLVSKEKSRRVFEISKELCALSYGDVTHSVNGLATLQVETNEAGELVRLSYDSRPISDKNLDSTEYQISKKNVKMSFVLKDEVHIKIEKRDSGSNFRLTSMSTNTTYIQNIDAVQVQGQISYEADGDWAQTENGDFQSQIHAKLRLKSTVLDIGNGTAGGENYFDLVMDSYNQTALATVHANSCGRAAGSYSYNLSFGRNSKQGVLVLEPSALIAKAKDPKSQKEEAATLALPECSKRAPVAFDLLMVAPVPPFNGR